MKILIVNRALGTLFGGGESFDCNAARYLMKRGHDVILITGRPLWGMARNTFSDLRVVYVPTPNLRHFAYRTKKLNTKVSAAFYHLDNMLFERAVWRWYSEQVPETFDIVQCCGLFDLSNRLLVSSRQPVVTWLPGPPGWFIRAKLPDLLANKHFGLFTRGTSEWKLKEMGFESGKEYESIPPGIDLDLVDSVSVDRMALRSELGIVSHALCGVTTARLVAVKNHGFLLEAIAEAKHRGVIWHWLFIGDGPLESRLKQRAKALGIFEQTHFLGYRTQNEVHRWLAVADIFALTSSYESYSIATLEAMAHRLPTIVTEVGYLKVLITKAESGCLVTPTDSAGLATILVDLSDVSRRQGYGQAGRRFVEKFNWPHIVQKLETFYTRIIHGRHT